MESLDPEEMQAGYGFIYIYIHSEFDYLNPTYTKIIYYFIYGHIAYAGYTANMISGTIILY